MLYWKGRVVYSPISQPGSMHMEYKPPLSRSNEPDEVFLVPRMLCAAGAITRIGAESAALGSTAFLVAPEAGVVALDQSVGRVEESLRAAGVAVHRFNVPVEPPIELYDEGVGLCRTEGCDIVVGIGGGSALDTAKAIALIAVHEGSVEDYQLGRLRFERRGLPMIAVPTTAGTGSEVSKVSVITNPRIGMKKSIGNPLLIPTLALLDPELTLSVPRGLTGSIGLDALSHAIESFVSLRSNPVTDALGYEAARLLVRSLPRAIQNPQDLEARESALWGSSLAGLAMNAGVGLAHILAQPISSSTGLSHSAVISVLLPHVIEANSAYASAKFDRLASGIGEATSPLGGATAVAAAVRKIRDLAGLPARFGDLGATREQLMHACDLALEWQSHILTNPRPVDRALLVDVLLGSL
jgi:alcohol dehydrogenase class IV